MMHRMIQRMLNAGLLEATFRAWVYFDPAPTRRLMTSWKSGPKRMIVCGDRQARAC